MRRQDPDGYKTLDHLQEFILHGEYQDKRRGHEHRTAKVAESGVKRRLMFYTAVRSFLRHNRAPLPQETFRIADEERESAITYMTLEQARAMIGALKDPYRTMMTASLYGAMGRGELLMLNRLWPRIRQQLLEGKDPIQIDFGRRKTNPNPYFTLMPAKILKPYEDIEANPFQGKAKKGIPRIYRPVKDSDLWVAWRFARKRTGIKEKIKIHMFRDLFRTLCYKVGVRPETSEFLMGHRVDKSNYLQIQREPETVIQEWQKLRVYLESGLGPEVSEEIRTLRSEVERLRGQFETLTKAKFGVQNAD